MTKILCANDPMGRIATVAVYTLVTAAKAVVSPIPQEKGDGGANDESDNLQMQMCHQLIGPFPVGISRMDQRLILVTRSEG